jgi:20S proteasome alpha/beta subunit
VTLVLAYPGRRAIVMASDGQITGSSSRDTTRKINVLNDHCLWSGAGSSATLGRVEESMSEVKAPDRPLSELLPEIRRAVRDAMKEAVEFDYRASFEKDWQKLDDEHGADFVFAELRGGIPRILSVGSKAAVEWIDRPFCVGNGTKYAYSLLRKYQGTQLDEPHGALLAYCVLDVAISVADRGVGPPIDIWSITDPGYARYKEGQTQVLAREHRLLRQREVELLRDWPLGELSRHEARQPREPASEEPSEVPV